MFCNLQCSIIYHCAMIYYNIHATGTWNSIKIININVIIQKKRTPI